MDHTRNFNIRAHHQSDASQLLKLMKQLAEFEGYIDKFQVTEESLRNHGFGEHPLFHAFVAECGSTRDLIGMAISYVLQWTYDMRPTLVLKELYVSEDARGSGVGQSLMNSIAQRAVEMGAARIQWTVLSGNTQAASFYSKLSGHRDSIWEPWLLEEANIKNLANAAYTISKPNLVGLIK